MSQASQLRDAPFAMSFMRQTLLDALAAKSNYEWEEKVKDICKSLPEFN